MANRNDDLAALARQTVDTASALRLLVEQMNDLGRRLSDYNDADLLLAVARYSAEDLRTVASALRGTAMMMVMDTDPAEWLRKLRVLVEQP
ncbi:hypothetical protein [Streptomyces cinereoruber]|uniref:hypothetical protein n=1 Tax=Streptomyces cinereoruber TaxID=67260 RepID=UPI0036323997